MSNTISEQTYEMIASVNSALHQANRNQKNGEARIAQANRSTAVKELEKDVVLLRDPNGNQAAKENPSSLGKGPQLPIPQTNWNGFQNFADNNQEGLIAIIGAVLALQAKTNSNFWTTVWKQASSSMMMQVKFAPIIGSAIQAQYDAQSANTLSQSTQSMTTGIVSLGMFVVSVGLGAYQEFKNPMDKLPSDAPIGFEKDADPAAAAAGASRTAADQELQEMSNEISNVDSDGEVKSDSKLERTINDFKEIFSRGQKSFTGFLQQFAQMSAAFAMLSQGSTNLIESQYKAQQAVLTKQEGNAATVSKEAEIYSQYYGQDFNREEDLRQGSGQNIDYAMNILQQAANSITATVKSMFGG